MTIIVSDELHDVNNESYWIDENGMCWLDSQGLKKKYCIKHKRTQLIDLPLSDFEICKSCERELFEERKKMQPDLMRGMTFDEWWNDQ
jgi:hypothetical protein